MAGSAWEISGSSSQQTGPFSAPTASGNVTINADSGGNPNVRKAQSVAVIVGAVALGGIALYFLMRAKKGG